MNPPTPPPLWNFSENSSVLVNLGFPCNSQNYAQETMGMQVVQQKRFGLFSLPISFNYILHLSAQQNKTANALLWFGFYSDNSQATKVGQHKNTISSLQICLPISPICLHSSKQIRGQLGGHLHLRRCPASATAGLRWFCSNR